MTIWGVAALSHDAAVAVVDDDDRIVFAAHSERYSRRKNDAELNQEIINEALEFGEPSQIVWYERPIVKKLRHVRAGQYAFAVDRSDLPQQYLRQFRIPPAYQFKTGGHHMSHA